MFNLFSFFNTQPETKREKVLSNQVDRLEFELAKAKQELEAAKIRTNEIQRQFDGHKLRDYPAAGSWVRQITISDLFHSQFQNPIEYVLADVEALGYDVSAAWMVHRATLDLAKQHEVGVQNMLAVASSLKTASAKVHVEAH